MTTGKMTPMGFIPSEPSMDAIKSLIGNFSGDTTDAEAPIDDAREKAGEDLLRCYVQVFSTPAGEKVLENLFDQTLRRSFSHPNVDAGIEQEALYSRERKGQNYLAIYIMRMIHDGMKLSTKKKPAPKKK